MPVTLPESEPVTPSQPKPVLPGENPRPTYAEPKTYTPEGRPPEGELGLPDEHPDLTNSLVSGPTSQKPFLDPVSASQSLNPKNLVFRSSSSPLVSAIPPAPQDTQARDNAAPGESPKLPGSPDLFRYAGASGGVQPANPLVPGNPAPNQVNQNPANAPAESTSTKLKNVISSRFGRGKGQEQTDRSDSVASKTTGVVNRAKNTLELARAAAGDVTAATMAAKKFLTDKQYREESADTVKKVAVSIVALFLCGTVLILGLVFWLLGPKGQQHSDTPNAISGNSLAAAGTYCAEMTDRLDYKSAATGKQVDLPLPGTTGRYSLEDPASAPGQLTTDHSTLSFYNTTWYDGSGQKHVGFTDAQLKYYVEARWPVFAWPFRSSNSNDQKRTTIITSASYSEYAGKEIMIYSPSTNKAAIGIAAEGGPAPWTGLSSGSTAYQAAETIWNGGEAKRYLAVAPPGFDGHISGGPQTLEDILGIANHGEIVIGFSKNQNAPLGATTCTPVKASPLVAGSHMVTPKVPTVGESVNGECGMASAAMVALHYNPDFIDTSFSKSGPYLEKDSAGDFITNPNICGSPPFLLNEVKAAAPGQPFTVVKQGGNQTQELAAIKKSIDNNDPVLIYTFGKPFTVNSPGHIVVIVGYDNTTFYINDPVHSSSNPNATLSYVNSVGGTSLTFATVLNDLTYDPASTSNPKPDPASNAMIIKSNYLK